MQITKEQVLENIEDVKKYINEIDNKKEEKKINITIKHRLTGSVIYESVKTTYKDAVVEAVESDANLCDADLRGADLYDANLCDAGLRGANLCDADLRGANLCDADLRGADLRGANLCDADLCDANLCDADLCDADLENTELGNVKFYGKTDNPKTLKKNQVTNFLKALGFIVE